MKTVATIVSLLTVVCFCADGSARIGGKTAEDGPFTLDNVEDLNTTAGGVDRAWMADYIFTDPQAFAPVALSGAGISLAAGQTPVGALRYRMPTNAQAGYVSYSFGVPMPSEPGASTLSHPGDISSFSQITFLVASSVGLINQLNQIILETYPGPTYPKLYWNFSITPGPAFQRVSLPLHSPTLIQNAGDRTVQELLAMTRYMSFYFYGGKENAPKTLTVHVDDIQLINPAKASVDNWTLY